MILSTVSEYWNMRSKQLIIGSILISAFILSAKASSVGVKIDEKLLDSSIKGQI